MAEIKNQRGDAGAEALVMRMANAKAGNGGNEILHSCPHANETGLASTFGTSPGKVTASPGSLAYDAP